MQLNVLIFLNMVFALSSFVIQVFSASYKCVNYSGQSPEVMFVHSFVAYFSLLDLYSWGIAWHFVCECMFWGCMSKPCSG